MSLRAGTAYVDILPRISKGFAGEVNRGIDGDMEETGRKAGGILGSTIGKVAAAAGGVFAATKVAQFFGDSISAASDLSETINKSSVIFRENASEIDKWSRGSAQSVGLSRQKALEAAAGFGDMFSQIGFTGKAAAGMSKDVVQMAADLGSFNNLKTDEVLDMISASMRGEYDSLQRVIPNINAARVEHEALAMSGKSAAKELTAQEKAAATLAIIHKDGARAAGDFAKTSDGLANSQKISAAEMENAKAKLGEVLLPVMLVATKAITALLVPAVEGLSTGLAWVGENIGKVAPYIAALAIGIGVVLAPTFIAWAIAAGAAAIATIAAAAPVILIAGAIALLAAGIIYAYQHFGIFRTAVDAAADVLQTVLGVAVDYAKFVIGVLVDYVKLIIRVVSDIVGGVAALFRGDWRTAWEKFSDIPKAIIDFLRGLLDRFVDYIGGLGGRINKLTGGMFDGIRDAFKAALNWIIDRWNGLEFKVPGIEAFGQKIGGFTLGVPDIPKFHDGGIVPGVRGSEMLAILQAGERVIPADEAGGKHYHLTLNGITTGEVNVREEFRRMEMLSA